VTHAARELCQGQTGQRWEQALQGLLGPRAGACPQRVELIGQLSGPAAESAQCCLPPGHEVEHYTVRRRVERHPGHLGVLDDDGRAVQGEHTQAGVIQADLGLDGWRTGGPELGPESLHDRGLCNEKGCGHRANVVVSEREERLVQTAAELA